MGKPIIDFAEATRGLLLAKYGGAVVDAHVPALLVSQLCDDPAGFSEFYQLTGVYFAAPKSKAPIKKNCTKGVFCIGKTGKGSCVKSGSKCNRSATQGSQDYTAAIGPQPGKKAEQKTEQKTPATTTPDKTSLYDSPETRIDGAYEGTGINAGARISGLSVPPKKFGGEILNQKAADKLGLAWVSTSRIAMLPDHGRDWGSYDFEDKEAAITEAIGHLRPIARSAIATDKGLGQKYVSAAKVAISDLYDRFTPEEKKKFDKNSESAEIAEFSEFHQLTGVYFAAPKSKAPIKKNCTKGVFCIGKTGKGSCVKAGSKCNRTAVENSQDYTAAIGPQPAKGEKKPAKAKEKAKPKPEPAKAPVAAPITTRKDFETEIAKFYGRIDRDEGTNDLVPIHKLRKELGDRVSREQFDDWMFEMQSNDLIQLQKAPATEKFTAEQTKDSISTEIGGTRHYVKNLGLTIPKDDQKNSAEGKKDLATLKSFEPAMLKAFDALNSKEDAENLVPIYKLRRELGDRVSRKDFDDWMLELQTNDVIQLQKGEAEDVTPDKIKDSITTELGGLRYYAKRLK